MYVAHIIVRNGGREKRVIYAVNYESTQHAARSTQAVSQSVQLAAKSPRRRGERRSKWDPTDKSPGVHGYVVSGAS